MMAIKVTCSIVIAEPLLYLQVELTNKLKRRILSQTSILYFLFDSSRFSHPDCGSSSVKIYANNRTLLEEKYWRKI